MFEGLRWRDALRESETVRRGADEGACCMSIQILSHSRASVQVRSQLFSRRQEFITEMEVNGIRRQEEVKNIKCLPLPELIA